MKFIISLIFLCLASFQTLFAQGTDASTKKTDSIAKIVIQYLKDRKPDSVYAMAGSDFREKITAENFTAITITQIFPMNNFEKVSYVSNAQGINKYKVEGTPALQLMIGLDAENKIGTLLVQPFIEEGK